MTVLVSFAEAVLTAPTVALAGGATLGATAMTPISPTEYIFIYTTAAPDLGAVAGEVAGALLPGIGLPMAPVGFAFTIIESTGEVWVRYPIADIRMTGFAPPRVDIFWSDAAKPAVGATETYRIEHTTSLTSPDWQPIGTVDRTRPFGETSFGVFPLTDTFLDPRSNFFRLFRAE